MKKRFSNNKGFSLVELIIVVAIMAILIGILAPQYMKYVEKSRFSADKDTIDEVAKAAQTLITDPDYTGGDITITLSNGGTTTFSASNVTGVSNLTDFTDIAGTQATLKSKTITANVVITVGTTSGTSISTTTSSAQSVTSAGMLTK